MSKKNKNWFEKVDKRIKEATDRIAERLKRTARQQLAELDKILGPDEGAKKERAKLKKED